MRQVYLCLCVDRAKGKSRYIETKYLFLGEMLRERLSYMKFTFQFDSGGGGGKEEKRTRWKFK